MNKYIGERELFYSLKDNSSERKQLTIRVSEPYLLKEGMVNFAFSHGTACCTISFDGLDEPSVDIYGMDTLQALEMAVDTDPYLKGMSKKYDFYWLDGEPYFD